MATISFVLGGIAFEYDDKNKKNIKKHGVDFHSAARVFFDYDRIEMVDDLHRDTEERYNTIRRHFDTGYCFGSNCDRDTSIFEKLK